MGLIARQDLINVPPPNLPPEWTSVPNPNWTIDGGTYDLSINTFDPEDDTLTYTLNVGSTALPTGVTLSSAGILTAASPLTEDTTTGIIVDIDDGTNAKVASSSFNIFIGGFPLFDVYSDIVNNRSGTPVPQSNTRYWDKPTYPSYDSGNADHSLHATVSALNSAISSASAGDVLFLADGNYSDSTTITIGVSGNSTDPITICAETLGGVIFNSGTILFNITGDYINVFGFKHTSQTHTTRNIYDVDGDYGVCAYIQFDDVWPGDSLNRHFYFHITGDYNRICYTTVDGKDTDYISYRTIIQAFYNRIDHNRMLDIRSWPPVRGGVTPGGGAGEAVQFGANSGEATNAFNLMDNNYIYRWNNDGAGNKSNTKEDELITVKVSSCMVIRNYAVDSVGHLNDRIASRTTFYANIVDGGGLSSTSGIYQCGDDGYAFCNYVVGMRRRGMAHKNGQTDPINENEYYPCDGCEASFNTIIDSSASWRMDQGGSGTVAPANGAMYNNFIEFDTRSGDSFTGSYTNYTFGGNVFDAEVVGDPISGITEADPATSTAFGYHYAQTSGNLDGTGVNGFHTLCTVDLLGNPVPSNNANLGAFQSAPATDPGQEIIDNSGALV